VTNTKRGKTAALAAGLALVAGTALFSGSASATTPPTTPAAPQGGSITYAAEQEFTSYNNATADQVLFANTVVLNMVQPGPYISMPDLTLQVWTDMMDSVELTSTDPQVVTYKIKPAAVWEDGAPIDCDDFYLAWISQNGTLTKANPDYTGPSVLDTNGAEVPETLPVFNAAGTTGYEDISKVECSEDKKTVTTTYSKKYVDYQGLFGNLIPAHVVAAKAGVADVMTQDPAEQVKLGDVWSNDFLGFDPTMALSGSWYKIDSFTPGETMVLKRNDKFFGKPGAADEIVIRLVADAAQQPAALANGDVQVIAPQPNPDLLKQLQEISDATASVEQGPTFEHYDFNQANEFLKDPAVRHAFAHCVDRQQIVDTLVKPLNPDATVLENRMYIPAQPQYKDTSNGQGTFDIEASKKLLTDAGFTFGADGIAEKDGKKLTLRLGRRDPNPRRQSTNELTIASCKAAGFDLKDDAANDFNSVRLPASDYDIALFAWVATPFQSSSTSIYVAGGGQNWNNYANPKIQELFDQANVEFDAAKRADLMNQIDATLWDDMATLPLFQFQDLVAYNNAIGNVKYNGPLGVTWNANEWTVAS
jgi:peptide/nickel transport system substrate-binding protein